MNIKSEKGITLVALIVSVIVMLILATVTLNTTFTAYETTRAEKFKAQLKVVQESVNSFYSDWQVWKTEKEYEYRDKVRKQEIELENALQGKTLPEEIAQIKADHELPEEQKLLSDGSMPQYFYDNVAGIDEYLNYKKGTYTEEIPSQTLLYLNGANPTQIVNQECYNEVFEKLKEVISQKYDFNPVDFEENAGEQLENNDELINSQITDAVNNTIFYEFNEELLNKILGLNEIDIPVFIDFENLVIFTTKPVRVSRKNVYTQYSFNDSGEIILNDTNSTMQGASILVDVKANYGTSQKIKLTLESGNVNEDVNKNDYVDYRIRKAYYQNAFVSNGNIKENVSEWKEVDSLKECEYSEDGNSVTFIVYESGYYRFRLEDVSGAYTVSMKQNSKMNIKNPNKLYSYEVIEDKNIDNDPAIEKAAYNITLCNAPVLNEDMIPVKWIYDDEKKTGGKWVVCTTIDPEWYNYSTDAKIWANVMMSYDTLASGLNKGDELTEKQMGSMFVWVPRFAWSNSSNGFAFLRGASSTNTYGQSMPNRNNSQRSFYK